MRNLWIVIFVISFLSLESQPRTISVERYSVGNIVLGDSLWTFSSNGIFIRKLSDFSVIDTFFLKHEFEMYTKPVQISKREFIMGFADNWAASDLAVWYNNGQWKYINNINTPELLEYGGLSIKTVDESGIIWAVGYNEMTRKYDLLRFTTGQWVVDTTGLYRPKVCSGPLNKILLYNSGDLLMKGSNGWSRVTQNAVNISSMRFDSKGNFWFIGENRSLFKLDSGFLGIPLLVYQERNFAEELYIDSDDKVWLTGRNKVIVFDGQSISRLTGHMDTLCIESKFKGITEGPDKMIILKEQFSNGSSTVGFKNSKLVRVEFHKIHATLGMGKCENGDLWFIGDQNYSCKSNVSFDQFEYFSSCFTHFNRISEVDSYRGIDDQLIVVYKRDHVYLFDGTEWKYLLKMRDVNYQYVDDARFLDSINIEFVTSTSSASSRCTLNLITNEVKCVVINYRGGLNKVYNSVERDKLGNLFEVFPYDLKIKMRNGKIISKSPPVDSMIFVGSICEVNDLGQVITVLTSKEPWSSNCCLLAIYDIYLDKWVAIIGNPEISYVNWYPQYGKVLIRFYSKDNISILESSQTSHGPFSSFYHYDGSNMQIIDYSGNGLGLHSGLEKSQNGSYLFSLEGRLFEWRSNTVTSNGEQFQMDFSLFPNPARNTVFLSSESEIDIESIRVFNIWGELIKEMPGGSLGGHQRFNLDVSTLPVGVYFINMIDEHKRIQTGKFVKY